VLQLLTLLLAPIYHTLQISGRYAFSVFFTSGILPELETFHIKMNQLKINTLRNNEYTRIQALQINECVFQGEKCFEISPE
jgi:hypothetical protein